MKKFIVLLLSALLLSTLCACAKETPNETTDNPSYTIGICNYVDDASLNQIVANIENRLKEISDTNNVTINILYDNCNADANVMNQIIANFIDSDVDLMVAIATPVAMAMQSATEDNQIPVIFAAVSDPLSVGLVDSLEKPGHNLSGTSDYLDTEAVIRLITALNPDIQKVGLLYDLGQDASLSAIASAKAALDALNISYIERCGTNVSEIQLAADALIEEKAEAIFTPQDNTVMEAQLSIYERIAEAKIPHYTGADSFALNGAFLGYGVDYANLGRETAVMIYEVLSGSSDISAMPVRTFDNGTATVNTETCAALGYDFEEVKALFAPYCTEVQPIETAESFE